ncbi:hypothetical protein VIGAN_01231100 [Vigna angularis var. angularis]|uniref:CCHC-type domain-containing protein n=1 Tax=Vigna angularis var. angularis TaxID=157739 RepID=A0A0S3R272_PHAAN|nr:hypothetical protein VIGAN_01231100 [Vigna angularis var. angularis]
MNTGETIYEVHKRFTHIVNHLMALGKVFDKEEINIKILKSLNRRWQPKVTTIYESKDLTSMNMATLFGKLREHELELGRLKDEEEIEEKKKSIALKVTSKKASKIAQSEDDSDAEMDNNKLMSMVLRKFNRLMKNNSQLTNHAGNNKAKKAFKSTAIQCYECVKEGHIKPDCPDLKMKQKANKRFPQDKNKKEKRSLHCLGKQ